MTIANVDLCPVCCARIPIPGLMYCSAECRTTAYRFRKRIAPVVAYLKRLGFDALYRHGTQLILTLPESLRTAYPPSLEKFEFAAPCWILDDINADDLWDTMRDQLGHMINGAIRWMFDSDYPLNLAVAMLDSAVKTALFEPQTHFVCDTCGGKFIESVKARDGVALCDYCAVERIPF